MAEREVPWFKVNPRAWHDVNVIIIPLVNIGPEPVADVDVTATGDHILDVSCRGRDFDFVGKVGDLGPGDRCVITQSARTAHRRPWRSRSSCRPPVSPPGP